MKTASESLDRREAEFKALIENPTPVSKYQLWQTISYKIEKKTSTKIARICGMHFVRLAIAFAEQCEPGWRYHIETEEGIEIIHEDQIEDSI